MTDATPIRCAMCCQPCEGSPLLSKSGEIVCSKRCQAEHRGAVLMGAVLMAPASRPCVDRRFEIHVEWGPNPGDMAVEVIDTRSGRIHLNINATNEIAIDAALQILRKLLTDPDA